MIQFPLTIPFPGVQKFLYVYVVLFNTRHTNPVLVSFPCKLDTAKDHWEKKVSIAEASRLH